MRQLDRKLIGVIFLTVLLAVAVAFAVISRTGPLGGGGAETAQQAGGVVGHPAKPFVLQDREGRTYRLSDFKGDVVLLHFWASWCPPCIDELPHLIDFARKHEGKGLKLVAISLDRTWEEAMSIFPANDLPDNLISLIDPESRTSNEYGSYEFPETYLIDPQQRIVTKWIGPQKWESEFFDQLVKRFL